MKFIIFSRLLIEQVKPYDKPHIIISVRTPGDPEDAKLPVGEQTLASLRLQFHEEYDHDDDVTAARERAEQRHMHHVVRGNAFTVETGRLVLDFVERYADKIEAVLVHCDAGLARSPAIAQALSQTIFLGEDNKFFTVPFERDLKIERDLREDPASYTGDVYEELAEREFIQGRGRFPTCFKYIMQAFGDGGVGLSTGEMSSGELELKLDIRGTAGSVYLSQEMWLALGETAGWIEPEQEHQWIEHEDCSYVDCYCDHCTKCGADRYSPEADEPCPGPGEEEIEDA